MPHVGRDRYPQWLNLADAVEDTAGTFKEVETRSVVDLSAGQVMEILKIQNEWKARTMGQQANAEFTRSAQISTKTQTAIQTLAQPEIIDKFSDGSNISYAEATETGAAGNDENQIEIHDFSSGDGHGFLTATKSFFLGVQGKATFSVMRSSCRILYRLVKVSSAELIGLVQETQ